ncbi:MAG: hypothetical protein SPH70_00465, partial [Candidatus Cryptobacteroides sp.]|nr:hypothetical protein [Bacteroidales bacterium]MDY6157544.1 hypothetical protein [Candidatus Cryptobacteroides sp.]
MKISNLALLSALALAAISSCGRKGETQTTEEAAVEELPAIGFYYGRYECDSTSIKSGDTFSTLMTRLGLGGTDTYRLTTLCDSVIDLRKIKAGNAVRAYYESTDSTRTLRYVIYDQSKVRSTVFQCSDSLAVWNYDKPVEHQRRLADVTIRSSLWNDML